MPAILNWRRWSAIGIAALVLIAGTVWWLGDDETPLRTHEQRLRVLSGPDNDQPVTLDTTLYIPEGADSEHRVPAVLLAHGFGGTKRSVTDEAQRLAKAGYAVMTWSARGFGDSGGTVHLDSPDYEVNDARRLIDVLAARQDIVLDGRTPDGRGDPRIAVAGASYGGGLALLLAGYDQRVDAVIPQITWNDLSRAFFPNSADPTNTDPTNADTVQPGVFKSAWAGALFGNNTLRPSINRSPADRSPTDEAAAETNDPGAQELGGEKPGTDATCGRLAPEICQLYLDSAGTGQASPRTTELLQRSSPAGILDQISAPTLLLQGTQDTLFPLAEADANARGIAATGTAVKVAWFTGGHDAAAPSEGERSRLRAMTDEWLSYYLKDRGKAPDTSFSFSQPSGVNVAQPGVITTSYSAPRYEGLDGVGVGKQLQLTGPPQQVANPPNGTPAALSSLPGLGVLLSLADSLPGGLSGNGASGDSEIDREVNGQHARFQTAPLTETTTVVGSPRTQLRIWSPSGTT
ncbi:MAG: alpha/beta hydrolase family protein, partial [Mycobacteriales bacterium]